MHSLLNGKIQSTAIVDLMINNEEVSHYKMFTRFSERVSLELFYDGFTAKHCIMAFRIKMLVLLEGH